MSHPLLPEGNILDSERFRSFSECAELNKSQSSKWVGRMSRPGFVYLAYRKIDGAYKIGISWNPEFRARQIGCELISYAPVPNMREEEAAQHRRYALFRLDGEWFRLSREKAWSVLDRHTELWRDNPSATAGSYVP